MDIAKLNAKVREGVGKGCARTLRRQGRIPGILYGSDIDNVLLSVDAHELEQMLSDPKYSRGLINLEVPDIQPTDRTVMIKEFQADPVRANFLHVDFYEVKMDQKITTTVAVVTTGIAKGVENGGILQIIRRELEVFCLPQDIPEQIVIDVSHLDMGESIHVQDIRMEGEVELPHDTNFTVVTVLSPKMEAPAAVEGGEGAGAGEAGEAE